MIYTAECTISCTTYTRDKTKKKDENKKKATKIGLQDAVHEDANPINELQVPP
jgi:hypothetical protein